MPDRAPTLSIHARFARVVVAAIAPLLLGSSPCFAAEPNASRPYVSVLRAHDANGLEIGMPFRDVARRLRLEDLGGGQYSARERGIAYNLEFTPLGRLFRINTEQMIGRFQPDYTFGRQLTAKLTAKYGPPHYNSLPDGIASWSGYTHLRFASGQVLPREIERLSARLTTLSGEVTLHIQLLDFGVLLRDQALLNQGPRNRGADVATF
ncbi:hypothetical protein [Phenylobacterium sp.]|uniref:hypothetical protein n=1 Tax=Phenylobacterium sp. TaxID=1871053 RepID=UPI00301C280A